MQRRHGLAVLATMGLVVATALIGCGGSDKKTDSPSDSRRQSSPVAGPEATVHAFLEGARSGNDEKVTSMLTPLARTELAKRQLWVAPASSDTARFEIAEVRYPAQGVAHVASRWIEVEPTTGQAFPTEMIWVLRRELEGWRIGGMAMIVFKDEPPLLLNFEQPDDMLRQKQMLQAEIARRTQQVESRSAVAEKPDDSTKR